MEVKCCYTSKSKNSKIGLMGGIYFEVEKTCTKSCPLLNNGCYAQKGLIKLLHRKFKYAEIKDIIKEVSKVKTKVVRYNISGDFFLNNKFNSELFIEFMKEAGKYKDVTFYGYTRANVELTQYTKFIPKNVKLIVSINNNDNEKRFVNEVLKLNYCIVIDDFENYKLKKDEVFCPIDFAKFKKVKDIKTNCLKCKLCITHDKNIVFVKV